MERRFLYSSFVGTYDYKRKLLQIQVTIFRRQTGKEALFVREIRKTAGRTWRDRLRSRQTDWNSQHHALSMEKGRIHTEDRQAVQDRQLLRDPCNVFYSVMRS